MSILKALRSPPTTHNPFRGKFCLHVFCNYSLKRIGTDAFSIENTFQTTHFLPMKFVHGARLHT